MEFHTMKRKDLQALCKKHNIPANTTNQQMADRLASLLKVEENPRSRAPSCLKDSGEKDGAKESNIVTGQDKKVRFSPRVEIVELEDSPDLKKSPEINKVARTRRRSMARPEPGKPETTAEKLEEVPDIPLRNTRCRSGKSTEGEVTVTSSPVIGRKKRRKEVDLKDTVRSTCVEETGDRPAVETRAAVARSLRKKEVLSLSAEVNDDDKKDLSPRKTRRGVVEVARRNTSSRARVLEAECEAGNRTETEAEETERVVLQPKEPTRRSTRNASKQEPCAPGDIEAGNRDETEAEETERVVLQPKEPTRRSARNASKEEPCAPGDNEAGVQAIVEQETVRVSEFKEGPPRRSGRRASKLNPVFPAIRKAGTDENLRGNGAQRKRCAPDDNKAGVEAVVQEDTAANVSQLEEGPPRRSSRVASKLNPNAQDNGMTGCDETVRNKGPQKKRQKDAVLEGSSFMAEVVESQLEGKGAFQLKDPVRRSRRNSSVHEYVIVSGEGENGDAVQGNEILKPSSLPVMGEEEVSATECISQLAQPLRRSRGQASKQEDTVLGGSSCVTEVVESQFERKGVFQLKDPVRRSRRKSSVHEYVILSGEDEAVRGNETLKHSNLPVMGEAEVSATECVSQLAGPPRRSRRQASKQESSVETSVVGVTAEPSIKNVQRKRLRKSILEKGSSVMEGATLIEELPIPDPEVSVNLVEGRGSSFNPVLSSIKEVPEAMNGKRKTRRKSPTKKGNRSKSIVSDFEETQDVVEVGLEAVIPATARLEIHSENHEERALIEEIDLNTADETMQISVEKGSSLVDEILGGRDDEALDLQNTLECADVTDLEPVKEQLNVFTDVERMRILFSGNNSLEVQEEQTKCCEVADETEASAVGNSLEVPCELPQTVVQELANQNSEETQPVHLSYDSSSVECSFNVGIEIFSEVAEKVESVKKAIMEATETVESVKAAANIEASEAVESVKEATMKITETVESVKEAATVDVTEAVESVTEESSMEFTETESVKEAAIMEVTEAVEPVKEATKEVLEAVESVKESIMGVNDAVDFVEEASMEVTETVESVKESVTTEVTETVESLKEEATLEVTEAVGSLKEKATIEVTEAIESVKEATTTEAIETVESVKEATKEVTEAVESVKEAIMCVNEAVDSAEEASMYVTETIESVKEAATTEVTDTVESVTEASMEVTETVESVKEASMEATETVESLKEEATIEVTEALEEVTETVESVKEASMEVTETVESLKEEGTIEVTEAVESVKEAGTIEVTEAVESVKEAGTIEVTEAVESVKEATMDVTEVVEYVKEATMGVTGTVESVKDAFMELTETVESLKEGTIEVSEPVESVKEVATIEVTEAVESEKEATMDVTEVVESVKESSMEVHETVESVQSILAANDIMLEVNGLCLGCQIEDLGKPILNVLDMGEEDDADDEFSVSQKKHRRDSCLFDSHTQEQQSTDWKETEQQDVAEVSAGCLTITNESLCAHQDGAEENGSSDETRNVDSGKVDGMGIGSFDRDGNGQRFQELLSAEANKKKLNFIFDDLAEAFFLNSEENSEGRQHQDPSRDDEDATVEGNSTISPEQIANQKESRELYNSEKKYMLEFSPLKTGEASDIHRTLEKGASDYRAFDSNGALSAVNSPTTQDNASRVVDVESCLNSMASKLIRDAAIGIVGLSSRKADINSGRFEDSSNETDPIDSIRFLFSEVSSVQKEDVVSRDSELGAADAKPVNNFSNLSIVEALAIQDGEATDVDEAPSVNCIKSKSCGKDTAVTAVLRGETYYGPEDSVESSHAAGDNPSVREELEHADMKENTEGEVMAQLTEEELGSVNKCEVLVVMEHDNCPFVELDNGNRGLVSDSDIGVANVLKGRVGERVKLENGVEFMDELSGSVNGRIVADIDRANNENVGTVEKKMDILRTEADMRSEKTYQEQGIIDPNFITSPICGDFPWSVDRATEDRLGSEYSIFPVEAKGEQIQSSEDAGKRYSGELDTNEVSGIPQFESKTLAEATEALECVDDANEPVAGGISPVCQMGDLSLPVLDPLDTAVEYEPDGQKSVSQESSQLDGYVSCRDVEYFESSGCNEKETPEIVVPDTLAETSLHDAVGNCLSESKEIGRSDEILELVSMEVKNTDDFSSRDSVGDLTVNTELLEPQPSHELSVNCGDATVKVDSKEGVDGDIHSEGSKMIIEKEDYEEHDDPEFEDTGISLENGVGDSELWQIVKTDYSSENLTLEEFAEVKVERGMPVSVSVDIEEPSNEIGIVQSVHGEHECWELKETKQAIEEITLLPHAEDVCLMKVSCLEEHDCGSHEKADEENIKVTTEFNVEVGEEVIMVEMDVDKVPEVEVEEPMKALTEKHNSVHGEAEKSQQSAETFRENFDQEDCETSVGSMVLTPACKGSADFSMEDGSNSCGCSNVTSEGGKIVLQKFLMTMREELSAALCQEAAGPQEIEELLKSLEGVGWDFENDFSLGSAALSPVADSKSQDCGQSTKEIYSSEHNHVLYKDEERDWNEQINDDKPSPLDSFFVAKSPSQQLKLELSGRKQVSAAKMNQVNSLLKRLFISSAVKRRCAGNSSVQNTPEKSLVNMHEFGMKENVVSSKRGRDITIERSGTKRRALGDLQNRMRVDKAS